MTKKRPKKVTPDQRLIAATSVIFCKSPVSPLPGFSEALNDALDASHAGYDRHRYRKAGIDWQPVVSAIDAAGNGDVLRKKPIRAKAVRDALATLEQTDEVKLAANSHYPAFIKWVRRRNDM